MRMKRDPEIVLKMIIKINKQNLLKRMKIALIVRLVKKVKRKKKLVGRKKL